MLCGLLLLFVSHVALSAPPIPSNTSTPSIEQTPRNGTTDPPPYLTVPGGGRYEHDFPYSDWPPEPWTHTQIYDRHQHMVYTLYGARGGQYSLPTVDKLLKRAIIEMRSPRNHDMEERATRRYCVAATETTSKLCLSIRPLLSQSKKWAINAILSYHNFSLRYGPQAAEFEVWRQDERGQNLHMANIALSGDFDDYPGSRFYPQID